MTDFDGTLSPVVEDRDTAVPLRGVTEALALLADRLGLVAVISGRPVSFLARALQPPANLVLAGLYGAERSKAGQVSVLPEVWSWRHEIARAVAEARGAAPPGLEVEDKGLSVALHSRRAPGTSGWARSWAESKAASSGLVARPGRLAVELLAPVTPDKGQLVSELGARFDAVCFVGDDTGDLPAFGALRRLRALGKSTVAVGVGSAEAPAELEAAVDVLVDGPGQVVELLRYLAV